MKELLSSKKFVASLIGLLAATGAHFGLALDETTIMAILSPILAYVIGQGVADIGKEKIKTEAKYK